MRVQGGSNLYGFSVGVLMLDTQFPRIPEDMGEITTLVRMVHDAFKDGLTPRSA